MYQNGEIDDSVREFLSDTHCRAPNFYLLPIIHKGILPPPGIPILSANGSPTDKLSQFTDHFLNPLCSKVKSYVKDTTHFLLILDLGDIAANCYHVNLDVCSLYTHLSLLPSVEAARASLESNRPHTRVKTSNKTLLELLDLVLTKNNFQFNGHNYIQTKGVSMGYRDDIFMIWPHTLEELDASITHLNGCTDSVHFTTEVSKTEIYFLDIKIRLNERKV